MVVEQSRIRYYFIPFLYLLASLLSLFHIIRPTSIPPGILLVGLGWTVSFFIPGETLYSLILHNHPHFQRAPFYERAVYITTIGVCYFGVLGLYAYATHLTWFSFHLVVCGSGVILSIIRFLISQKNDSSLSFSEMKTRVKKLDKYEIFFLVFIALVVFISYQFSGFFVGDTTRFWTVMKRMISYRQINTFGTYLHPNSSNNFFFYRNNFWMLWFAWMDRFSGVSYIWNWFYFGIVVMTLRAPSTYAVARILFKDRKLALFCGFVEIINTLFFTLTIKCRFPGLWNLFGWGCNPKSISFIILNSALVLLFSFLKDNKTLHLVMAGLFASLTFCIHESQIVFFVLWILFYILAHFLVHGFKNETSRRLIKAFIVTCLIFLPLLAFRFYMLKATDGGSLTNVIPKLSPSVENFNPIKSIGSIMYSPITILSLLLTPLLILLVRRKSWAPYLVGSMVFTPIIAYNPLQKLIPLGYMLNKRAPTLFPVSLVVGLVFYRWLERFHPPSQRRSWTVSAFWGLMIASITMFSFVQFNHTFSPTLFSLWRWFKWPFSQRFCMVMTVINILLLMGEVRWKLSDRVFKKWASFKWLSCKENNSKQHAYYNPLLFASLLSVVMAITVLPVQVRFFGKSSYFQTKSQRAEGPEPLRFLDRHFPPASTVLYNGNGYSLTSYTNHFVSLNNNSILDHLISDIPLKNKLEYLRRDKVDIIMIDKVNRFLAAWPDRFGEEVLPFLEPYNDIFHKVFENDQTVIYQL